MARLGLPLKMIILNNHCHGMVVNFRKATSKGDTNPLIGATRRRISLPLREPTGSRVKGLTKRAECRNSPNGYGARPAGRAFLR